jgi:hypothetical protein
MKKSILVMAGLAGMIITLSAFTKDEPRYKNLKVLPKNITKEQLDSVMHHFSLSLGVRCNFCHVRNDSAKTFDFASDDNKHKLAARSMMKMMDKINDKYFDITGGKRNLNTKLMVTCYTCHHGSTEPATVAPMPQKQEGPKPQTDSSKNNQADTTRHNR